MSYLVLFVVCFFSGGLLLIRSKAWAVKSRINILLAFSASYLLGICFLHLIPDIFAHGFQAAGLFLLIGFFLQLGLDYFSGGIEHGHTHISSKRLGRFPLLVFVSLGIHSYLEALPVEHLAHEHNMNYYLVGLLLHKAPIAFVLVSLLLAYQLNKRLIWIALFIFSILGPLGVWTGNLFESTAIFLQASLAISVGIILHLSTTILLETNEEHSIEWEKLLPILFGILLSLFSI